MESIEIKKRIAKLLALRNKLQPAAMEILENGDLSVMDVATKYGIEYYVLSRKIDIMKRKKEFYDKKQRFDAARKEIIEGKSTYKVVSKSYGIHMTTLRSEMKKARAQESYEYDKKISRNGMGFTYLQEESLLKILINWGTGESLQRRCSCQLCALEKLLTFAYEFAQQYNVEFPFWNNTSRQVSINWLIDFEMRHSDEISYSFHSLETCLKQIQAAE